jgi:hypothetical protein
MGLPLRDSAGFPPDFLALSPGYKKPDQRHPNQIIFACNAPLLRQYSM